MATYSTDLTTATNAESGTWTEFSSANSGGTPAADGENFIQGTDCRSQTTGTKSGTANPKSVVYQHGSDLATGWTSGDAFFIWTFYAVGANLYDFDQTTYSGYEIGIGADITNVDRYFVGGANWGRNPYGGWANFAVDPEATASTTYGSGGAGYQYIGGIAYTINAISKGTPHAVDAIRYGRGQISVTGSGGTFLELAQYNDYNAGGTPPGTSSTSVDSGRHRLGLFQESSGTYLWKGLMSFGLSGTSVTFSDSNETIIIEDCPHTYASFNKVEVNNASSSVTWNSITFIATASTANGKGQFEMVDNATVSMTGCSFNSMDSFTYLSNATVTGCNFNGCGVVNVGGANFSGCSFNSCAPVTASSPANAALVTNSDFVSSGTGHGLEITGTAANMTLTNCNWSGYAATDGSTGNEAVYVNIASGSMNLTIDGGTTPSVRTAGVSVTVISGAVTVTARTVTENGTNIQDARVHLEAASGGVFPVAASVTISNSGTTATVTHNSHGLATNDKVVIRGASLNENLGVHSITVTDTNTYTYTMSSAPGSSPTGTITSTFVVLNGLTDVNGEISMSRVFSGNQPVTGRARKSSSAPYFKNANLTGTVSSSTGGSFTAVMISDD